MCVRNSHFFSLLCCLLHPWLQFKPTLKVKDIWVIAIKDFSPNFCCHQVVTSCPFISTQLFTISVCHLWFINEQSNATWNLLSGGYGFKFPNLIYDYRPSMPFWKCFFCITFELLLIIFENMKGDCLVNLFFFFLTPIFNMPTTALVMFHPWARCLLTINPSHRLNASAVPCSRFPRWLIVQVLSILQLLHKAQF